MASSNLGIKFLDLTDVDEAECIHLQQVLDAVIPNVELPWVVKNEIHSSTQGFEPPPFGGEPPNGPPMGLVTPMESFECNAGSLVSLEAATSPSGGVVQNHSGGGSGESQFHPESSPVPMMPLSVPSSVTPTTQPVITTMYGMPLSSVYVGNVTANVNVHSFVGTPLTPYSHLPQQVFPPGEVPIPNEPVSSPNGARNGIGPRRPRASKPGGKRVDVPFAPRTPGVGHGHDVLTTAIVDSPPGPPTLPSNYIFPVPSMHHPFQSFYASHAQPPHGAPHLSQHPSATGARVFLPVYPTPIFNAYQPGASGHMVYPASPSIVPAPCVTTEQSGIVYPINNESERMMPEGRETDVTVQEQQAVFHLEETQEIKNSVNGEEKIGYSCEESDHEACVSSNSVGVDNSKLVSGSECNNELPEQCSVKDPLVDDKDSSINDNELVKSAALTIENASKLKANISPHPVVVTIKGSVGENVSSSEVLECNTVSALNTGSTVTQLASQKVESDVSNGFHFPGTPESQPPKVKSSASASSSFNSPLEPSQGVREKTWASLFNKSGSSNIPSDGAMILTMTPSSSKPLAAVRPFQNAVTVTPGSSDSTRKVLDTTSIIGDSSRHFPQLGQSDVPPSPMADDPHLYRLGEFLSKYQLDHRAISLQPRGLTNRSNWCYINSTLQALLACPPFYNLLKSLSVPRKGGKSSTPIIDSMVEFVNEFSPLSPASRVNRKEKAQRKDDAIEVQAGPAFEPCYIYKMLSNIQSDTFKVEGRQEDAEEFFSCLLNALNDEMLELIKLIKDPSTDGNVSNGDVSNSNANDVAYENDDTEWKVMGKKNKGSVTRRAEFVRTPVSDIFRGQLRSRVQRAGDHSDNVQPFFTLQLDIEKAQSVKEALDLLGGRDQLEGVTCSRTNQEVEAWQQVTLEELPLVLVLHLKWFNYKIDGCTKIVKTVEFPIDLKVDGKLMSFNKYSLKQKQYKLFAVVYHDGKEATKGHYITDVYHVGYGGWIRYDDSSVKAIQETQMLHPRGSRVPYLLYYRRCDTIGGPSTTPDKR